MFKISDRIRTIDNYYGKIKYIGIIETQRWSSNTLVYGIEWDDPLRGTNNGCLDGKAYFDVEIKNSGSFIKCNSKKISNKRFNFVEALNDQYKTKNQKNFEEVIYFGNKTVELIGFKKHNEIQSNFVNLQYVSLNNKDINSSYHDDDKLSKDVIRNLNSLIYLDMSFNLFNNLEDVWRIIDLIPKLLLLNLNGNRFECFNRTTCFTYSNLRILKLCATNIKVSLLQNNVLKKFLQIEELHLSKNRYNDEDLKNIDLSKNENLKLINLSFNNLTKIPEFIQKSFLTSIDLSENKIKIIKKNVIENIKYLDLRGNLIFEWDSINLIYTNFPNLNELRINNNPIFSEISVNEMTINLIGRFECADYKLKNSIKLTKLNGSFLSNEEIISAELYFISKVKRNEISFDIESKRWKFLTQKHDINFNSLDKDNFKTSQSTCTLFKDKISLIITYQRESETVKIKKTFLKSTSILRFKGIISKIIKKNFLDFLLFYYSNEFESQNEKIKITFEDLTLKIDDYILVNNQSIFIE